MLKSLTKVPDTPISSGKVLALDLGRRTGWCLGESGKYVNSGVHELYAERAKDFTDGERFQSLYNFLTQHMDIDAIVFEQVAGGTKGRQTVLFNGYRATLLLFAMMLGKPVIPLPVGTIKKYTVGKGNASKEEMMEAVREMGIPTFDDNEADAVAAFHTACTLDVQDQVLKRIAGERDV